MPRLSNCEYGRRINAKLGEKDKTKNWLIDEVKTVTGLYFDSSYLSKIKRGELKTPGIIAAINEILEIDLPQDTDENNT